MFPANASCAYHHMLPTHRSSPSKADPSCINKRPSFALNKLILRWIGLAIVVIAFIWFAGPLLTDSLRTGRSELEYPPPIHSLRPPNPPPEPSKEEQDIWEPRKNQVKAAFVHAWSGYRKLAFPNDELKSLTGGKTNKFALFSLFFFFPFISKIHFHWNFYINKLQWLGCNSLRLAWYHVDYGSAWRVHRSSR